jgi:hypothetical protein
METAIGVSLLGVERRSSAVYPSASDARILEYGPAECFEREQCEDETELLLDPAGRGEAV